MSAILLQNGKQAFSDSNGNPLVGGSVYFYAPSTSTPKDTWQDSLQATLNTNPVILNARGEASIYGSGAYRQVVRDASGNQIWDAVIPDLQGTLSFLQAGTGAVSRPLQSKMQEVVSAEDFGADGTGAADTTTQIQAALNSLVGSARTLRMTGAYKVSSLTIPDHVCIDGGGSITFTGASGNLLTIGVASKISNMALTHASNPTGTVMAMITGNRGAVVNCQFTNYFNALNVGTSSTLVVGALVDLNNFFAPYVASGSGGIFLQNYSSAIVTRNVMAGPAYPTVQPDYGLRIHNGDTGFITDNNITNHGINLYMDVPVGLHNYALRISGSLFDSGGTITSATLVDSALLIPAGNIYDMLVVNTWFGLSKNGNGLQLNTTGTGNIDGLCLDNCQYVGNAIAGLNLVSTRLKNIKVTGGYASANATYGLRAGPGVTDFEFLGVKASNVGARGGNGRGINVDTGASDNYIITGCTARASTVFNFFDGGSGTNKVVTNNIVA